MQFFGSCLKKIKINQKLMDYKLTNLPIQTVYNIYRIYLNQLRSLTQKAECTFYIQEERKPLLH
jgi:hypothetical protein